MCSIFQDSRMSHTVLPEKLAYYAAVESAHFSLIDIKIEFDLRLLPKLIFQRRNETTQYTRQKGNAGNTPEELNAPDSRMKRTTSGRWSSSSNINRDWGPLDRNLL